MSASKDKKRGTWKIYVRYTDWKGEVVVHTKRGFATKKEALEYERAFLLQKSKDLNMTFEKFFERYKEDKKTRLKENTWESKEHIVRTKILPYFRKRPIADIEAQDVIAWQNELMSQTDENGKAYSATYLRTIHAQLSAIFNHAVRYYNLSKNPAKNAGTIGKKESKEMEFWTTEEYLKFAEVMMDKPRYYYAFEVLYWTGMRLGEMLALTPNDFDFEKMEVRINKSYQHIRGKDVITTPKTEKANRTIKIPDFLCDEIKDYMEMNYGLDGDDRLFPISKSGMHHEMDRGSKAAGVKRIRIHDLRHSAVSLLIEMGFSVLAIADRVGHESTDITFRYAHLFPTKQTEMAESLSALRSKGGR